MESNKPDLKSIFSEALERPAGPERLAYLEGVCGDDPVLRARADELLFAYARAGGFLGSSPGEATADSCGETDKEATLAATDPPDSPSSPGTRPSAEGPGSRIGPYKLLQEIGQGGMGAVFMAEQEKPVRRRVALKVIKAGMDSAQVIARFEAERQALALMDHPSIARVFDAGTTDSCRPFFVMELVKGIPITEYCDEARLSPKERLELFIPVCQAIQHAHQKGIIHRDIKPSNVLITLIDGKPVPKVIDFGVAKAIDQQLTEKTLFTQYGSIVGTLEYMSPEQADLSGLDVDTRSDLYSLGVLLYELLTGTTPLERERLREACYAEILKRIKEEVPPKPSTRLSGSGDRLASIAAVRGIEPGRLTRAVRGDLDWIVMKALEKSRTRRYETANGFARDVQRYLDGDPVEARPPSASYRLGKFARKYRAVLATAASLAMVLIAATAFSFYQAVRARRAAEAAQAAEREARLQRDEASQARDAEAAARRRSEESQKAAQAEADKAKAINDFLTQDLLTQAEPANNAAEDHVSLLEALDRAAAKVGDRFAGQPEVADALRETIAITYHGLASWEKAERQWRALHEAAKRRLGGESREALVAASELTHILYHRGRFDAEAIEMARTASEGLARLLGPDHLDTFSSRNNLGLAYQAAGRTAEAIPLFEATLKAQERTLGPDHSDTLSVRGNLAMAYGSAGRTAEAISLYESALKSEERTLGLDHPGTLKTRSNLAIAYRDVGRTAEAGSLLEATLKAQERKLGPDHPDTLFSRNGLATAYRTAGRLTEAIALHEATLQARERTLGPDHPDTLLSRTELALAYVYAHRAAEAVPLYEATLKAQERTLGPDHPATLYTRNNLAGAYWEAHRIAEATALFKATLEARERTLGLNHPATNMSRNCLANVFQTAGRTAEAISLREATLKASEIKFGPDHPSTLSAVHALAHALEATKPKEAEPLFRRALETYRSRQRPEGELTNDLTGDLGHLLDRTDRAAEAEALYLDSTMRARNQFGPADPRTAMAMAQLGVSLIQQGKWLAAEPVLRECLAVREKIQPEEYTTFSTRSLLGGSLLGQKKYAEAEPLILAGYKGLKAREAKIPPQVKFRLTEAAERVLKLYKVWGKKDQADEWQKKLRADLPSSDEVPRDPFAQP
jgi:eukaryotic-like serine/threonine-protein kinase